MCDGSTSVAGSMVAGSERVIARAALARSRVTYTSHGRDGLEKTNAVVSLSGPMSGDACMPGMSDTA